MSRRGPVELAVGMDLQALELTSPGVSKRTEAAMAISLATRLDDPTTKATSAAMASGRLLETMVALRDLARSNAESPLNEIRARRDARVARLPKAEDRTRAGRGGSS
jgi:hypothetical protein